MMNLLVERVDVWGVSIEDRPGSLAKILASLREVGVDLDFIIARRAPEKPGTGVVFVTPLRGDLEIAAASRLGVAVTDSIHSLRVQGEYSSAYSLLHWLRRNLSIILFQGASHEQARSHPAAVHQRKPDGNKCIQGDRPGLRWFHRYSQKGRKN